MNLEGTITIKDLVCVCGGNTWLTTLFFHRGHLALKCGCKNCGRTKKVTQGR